MKDEGLRRREFLQNGVAATLGVGVLGVPGAVAAAAGKPQVGSYRTLGKTGIQISDIGFGTGATKGPHLIRYALERGITYFDTAESYPLFDGGKAEVAIGRALAGRRDEVVLGSKTEAKKDDSRAVLMGRLEASLKRLNTDRIDLYFNHAVNELERLTNEEWFEFVELAKKQGKIRFSGMSGHGGHLKECLDTAIENDLVDVILVAHNFGQDPKFYEKFTRSFDLVANQEGLPKLLARAHAKGIGVIAMKTLMGAKLNDLRSYEWEGSTFAQAAFRWVLSNPDVDALVVSMKSRPMIDEYLGASGKGVVRENDVRLLQRYLAKNGEGYCRHGCDACESSCAYGVPISEVLRTRMYATHYRDVDLARASYAALGAGASACLSCDQKTCAGTCPYGLDVPGLTGSTPDILERG